MNLSPQPQRQMELGVQDVKSLIDSKADFLLVDCRRPEEFEFCRLADAVLIPMNDTPARLEELEASKEKQIVVYCHHGVRSLNVTQFLRKQGFDNVQSMAGGIDAWSDQVDPNVPKY